MLQMALRIPGPQGHPPCGLITTTPKNQMLLRQIMASPTTVITSARTADNAANLDPSTLAFLYEKYACTRLGRQELEGELLTDVPGALWTRDMMEAAHVPSGPAAFRRVVVAIDPAGSSNKNSDETGIIVAGIDTTGIGYVLADLSGKYSPDTWSRKAVEAYKGWKADRIVAEKNYGGDMVENTIRSITAAFLSGW